VSLTVEDDDGATDTDTITVNVGNATPIAEGGGICPSWSPDGSKIAFMFAPLGGYISYSGGGLHIKGNWEIYIMDANGGNLHNLTNHPAADISFSWSPNGKKIAFVSFRDGNGEVYVMNADGSNQHNLTNRPDIQAFLPYWSPDGTKIAFVACNELIVTIEGETAISCAAGDTCGIYVMDANGSNLRSFAEVVNDPDAFWFFTWSPNGSKIAFMSSRDGNYEIHVANADGSNQHNITNNPANDVYPVWSPDGKKIAFISWRDGNPGIYLMNADGSDQRKLTDLTTYHIFLWSWSHDSTKIAFTLYENDNLEIYIVNIDGSNLRNLTNHPAGDFIWFSPWSPNDAKIVFASDRDGIGAIYVMNADGSNQQRLTK